MIELQYNRKSEFVDIVEGITTYGGFRVIYNGVITTVEEMIKYIKSNGILREPVSFAAPKNLYPRFNEISGKLEEEISKRNHRRL